MLEVLRIQKESLQYLNQADSPNYRSELIVYRVYSESLQYPFSDYDFWFSNFGPTVDFSTVL